MVSPSPAPQVRRVRAVVLNWNGGEHVVSCVSHLLATDWPADRLEVVVVDNASTDGSDQALRAAFGDRIALVANDRNDGFPANNLALVDVVDGSTPDVDAVALVNNDAEVAPGWLAPLVDALDADPGLGAACPLLVFAPRYAELEVRSATFRPGAGDPRRLGVRISGVEVADVDRWDDVLWADGAHDPEVGADGQFRWTAGVARLRVPVPDGASGDVAVRVRLSCEHDVDVELVGGDRTVTARVDATATWVLASVDAERAVDVVQNAGSTVRSDGAGVDRGFGEPVGLHVAAPAEVVAWCGGAVLLRSTYLAHVGLFHPPYFLYYEDVDLAWRGAARGWRYRFVPGSVVRHRHAASSGTSSAAFQRYNERNRLLLLVRNAPWPLVRREVGRFVTDTWTIAANEISGPLRRRRPPRPVMAWRRIRALASLARLAPAEVPERRRLRRAQTVPDAHLLGRLSPVSDR